MRWQERVWTGMTGEFDMTVSPELTAHHFGNAGVRVLATAMVGLFAERALLAALAPHLPTEMGLVGVRQQVNHRAPASVGVAVKAVCVVTEVKGRRVSYDFRLEASDGRLLADGNGEGAVVSLQAFMERAGVHQVGPGGSD